MPNLALVAISGFRVRERDMLDLGMTLPGLHDRASAISALPSLGLLTLAGMTPPGWNVSYHDPEQIDGDLISRIVREQPTLVAISALTASIEEAYRLSDQLRAAGVATVLGGLHVAACPQEAIAHADAIVIGDGEPVWQQVLSDAERSSLKPMYRAAVPFDLRLAAPPRYDLLKNGPSARFTLQTARGCPLACDFCAASRMLGPFREKPIGHIERELDAICDLDSRPLVELADDNTFAGRRDVNELFDALERRRIRYFTECDWRIGERPALLERLAASGCMQVLIGIESLVHEHGGMGAKRARLDRIMAAVNRVQDHGVAVNGCFIVGSDGEDLESLQRLADFLVDAPLADVQLTLQTPFPGTALHQRLAREGRLLNDRSWSSYTLFDVTYVPDRLTVAQLESGFCNLVRHAFSQPMAAQRQKIRQAIWKNRTRDV